MPAQVTAEDIINITGRPARIDTKIPVLPVNQENSDKSLQRETTFLASWEPEKQGKISKVSNYLSKSVSKWVSE